MLKRLSLTLIFLLAGTGAHADFMGLYVGGGLWKSDFKGDIIANIGLDTDLNLDGTSANYYYVALEHPVPVLPNIRIEHTSVDDTGVGTLSGGFTFAGQTFVINQPVTTTLDLTHTDFTLYYELLDTGAELDLGITARVFDGEVIMNTARQDLEGGVPMLYVRAKMGLPFIGGYVNGSLKTLGSQHTDYNVGLGWETENFILPEVGIEAGYRNLQVDLDTDDVDVDVDMTFDGYYITLNAHF